MNWGDSQNSSGGDGEGEEPPDEGTKLVWVFRTLKPYMQSRLDDIQNAGQTSDLEAEVEEIKKYLKTMETIREETFFDVEMLQICITKICDLTGAPNPIKSPGGSPSGDEKQQSLDSNEEIGNQVNPDPVGSGSPFPEEEVVNSPAAAAANCPPSPSPTHTHLAHPEKATSCTSTSGPPVSGNEPSTRTDDSGSKPYISGSGNADWGQSREAPCHGPGAQNEGRGWTEQQTGSQADRGVRRGGGMAMAWNNQTRFQGHSHRGGGGGMRWREQTASQAHRGGSSGGRSRNGETALHSPPQGYETRKLELGNRFRAFAPYLGKRLYNIGNSGRTLELAEEVDQIKFYLDIMKDTRIGLGDHHPDQLQSYIDIIHGMERRNPMRKLKSGQGRQSSDFQDKDFDIGGEARPKGYSPKAERSSTSTATNTPFSPTPDAYREEYDVKRRRISPQMEYSTTPADDEWGGNLGGVGGRGMGRGVGQFQMPSHNDYRLSFGEGHGVQSHGFDFGGGKERLGSRPPQAEAGHHHHLPVYPPPPPIAIPSPLPMQMSYHHYPHQLAPTYYGGVPHFPPYHAPVQYQYHYPGHPMPVAPSPEEIIRRTATTPAKAGKTFENNDTRFQRRRDEHRSGRRQRRSPSPRHRHQRLSPSPRRRHQNSGASRRMEGDRDRVRPPESNKQTNKPSQQLRDRISEHFEKGDMERLGGQRSKKHDGSAQPTSTVTRLPATGTSAMNKTTDNGEKNTEESPTKSRMSNPNEATMSSSSKKGPGGSCSDKATSSAKDVMRMIDAAQFPAFKIPRNGKLPAQQLAPQTSSTSNESASAISNSPEYSELALSHSDCHRSSGKNEASTSRKSRPVATSTLTSSIQSPDSIRYDASAGPTSHPSRRATGEDGSSQEKKVKQRKKGVGESKNASQPEPTPSTASEALQLAGRAEKRKAKPLESSPAKAAKMSAGPVTRAQAAALKESSPLPKNQPENLNVMLEGKLQNKAQDSAARNKQLEKLTLHRATHDKRIAIRDTIVNPGLGKIKLEADWHVPIVKLEEPEVVLMETGEEDENCFALTKNQEREENVVDLSLLFSRLEPVEKADQHDVDLNNRSSTASDLPLQQPLTTDRTVKIEPQEMEMDAEPPKLNCHICNYSGQKMVHHYVNQHYPCDIPEARLVKETFHGLVDLNMNSSADSQRLEIRLNTSITPIWPCLYCDTRFDTVTECYDHLTSHTGEYRFECGACHRSCPYRNSLVHHLKHRHEKGLRSEIMKQPGIDKDAQELAGFLCTDCFYFQLRRENIMRHVEESGHSLTEVKSVRLMLPATAATLGDTCAPPQHELGRRKSEEGHVHHDTAMKTSAEENIVKKEIVDEGQADAM